MKHTETVIYKVFGGSGSGAIEGWEVIEKENYSILMNIEGYHI